MRCAFRRDPRRVKVDKAGKRARMSNLCQYNRIACTKLIKANHMKIWDAKPRVYGIAL
jgi:hypothetical protein